MRANLKNLRDEAETTLRVMYALRSFRQLLTNRQAVNKVNDNPYFWMIWETSLRTSLFIGIRRIYEINSGTNNFQKFIDTCIKQIKQFSAESLKQRKIDGSDTASEWIDEYMKDIHIVSEQDFKDLSKLVRSNSKNMKGIYMQAASQIFAHSIHVDDTKMQEFEEKLNFDDIEQAITSVWHVHQQVWQMYENGRSPTLQIEPYPYVQEVLDSVDVLLKVDET